MSKAHRAFIPSSKSSSTKKIQVRKRETNQEPSNMPPVYSPNRLYESVTLAILIVGLQPGQISLLRLACIMAAAYAGVPIIKDILK